MQILGNAKIVVMRLYESKVDNGMRILLCIFEHVLKRSHTYCLIFTSM